MHSEPGLPEPVSTPCNRDRRTAFRRGFIAFGVLLLILIFFFSGHTPPEDRVVWLTPDELARIKKGSLLGRIQDKLMRWPTALWKFYWGARPQILIDSSLLTLPATAAEQTGLGAPVATNTDGMRAWILSPAEWSRFRQRLKTIPDVALLGRPRAQTAAGSSATTFFGGTKLVAGTNVPIGLTLDLAPKVRSGSIQLLISATATEFVASPPANAPAVRSNLAVACRALLPNSGGLVVVSGNASPTGGSNYWLILSPTAVDARGNPIKL